MTRTGDPFDAWVRRTWAPCSGTPPGSPPRVTATGDLDLTAHAGQPLDFTVTLTSKQDLPLDPCPDHTVLTSAGQSSRALDCAAVPYPDARGRPTYRPVSRSPSRCRRTRATRPRRSSSGS
jgi:hypothetical protein